MTQQRDIDWDFDYHRPDQDAMDRHQAIRDICKAAAKQIEELVPDSREKSLALTNLEQAMFWANAAIARERC